MTVHNAEIASLFKRYAVLLEIKGGANPFRIRAYRNAARTVENLPRDVSNMLDEGCDLTELPGIGNDLAHKISEIVHTQKFPELDSIAKRVPLALAELTTIPGLGPKRIKTLFERLKIGSVKNLASAVRAGKLKNLRGFGPKIEAAILKAAAPAAPTEQRMLLSAAEHIAAPLVRYLQAAEGVIDVEVAGSYRRRKETVGDLDILATGADGEAIVQRFIAYEEVAETLAKGTTRASVRLKSGL